MRQRPIVRLLLIAVLSLLAATTPDAQRLEEAALAQLQWRAIGPAVMGGRIDDIEVDERNSSTIYVGAASGGLWKTINAGTTWTPLFDRGPICAAVIGEMAPTRLAQFGTNPC
jgi:hypothetical protein